LPRWRRALTTALAALALGLGGTSPPAQAAEPTTAPLPRIEAGMHTAPIMRIATDAQGRWAVTASFDKTARIWEVSTGKLLDALRPPQDRGHEGKLDAVAMSPDGRQVAVAGYTGWDWSQEASIYLYDRSTQQLERRLIGLPDVVSHLAYSADGRWLAAGLIGKSGVRVFDSRTGALAGSDSVYGGSCFSVEFSPAGSVQAAAGRLELLSSSWDGQLRIHSVGDQGQLGRPRVARAVEGGKRPFAARFSPDGRRVAVGFEDSTAVQVLASDDLREVLRPDVTGVGNGSPSSVAWSADGQELVAGGRWSFDGKQPMRRWSAREGRKLGDMPLMGDTVMDLVALPAVAGGGWLFAGGDPAWGRVDGQGRVKSRQDRPLADLRGFGKNLALSESADRLRFWFKGFGNDPFEFDVARREVLTGQTEGMSDSARTSAPGVDVQDWQSKTKPRLNGQPIELDAYETSFSLAISADGQRFALGTQGALRLYDHSGSLLWRQPVPDVAWAVNLSRDGRWLVAGYGDGTIRWHRVEDGREVLALFAHIDKKRWVLWTPEGFYAASAPGNGVGGGEELLGYHLNRGREANGEFVSATQLREAFYQPQLVSSRLAPDGDERMKAAVAQLGDIRQLLDGRGAPRLALRSAAAVTTDAEGSYVPEVELLSLGSPGQGRARLLVKIDGVEVAARYPTAALAPRQRVRLDGLPLGEGAHRVSVELVDGRGLASPPVVAQVMVPPRPKAQRGTLHVLAVGVSRYRDGDLNLKFAADDARAIVAKAKERGASLFNQQVVAEVLTDADATVAKIDAKLRAMAKKAQPDDTFVLYLAGHGTTAGPTSAYHFLPHELEWANDSELQRQAISQDRLREWLSLLPVKSLLLLDSCRAGNAVQLASRAAEDKSALSTLVRVSNRAVIVASSGATIALEGHEGHGIFTWVVLDALDKADYDGNGMVDVSDIAMHVRRWVPEISERRFNYRMVPMQDTPGNPFPVARPAGK
jgi:WD40 repeat protein